jgi:iron complex outermembrane receptor protein
MKKTVFFIAIIALLYSTAFSQKKDTLLIDEVEISSSRSPTLYSETARILFIIDKDKIENAPVQSLNDLLKYGLNVDIRKRGAGNIQSDISIRGGSFEQTLVLLNGVKVNDPQTGHHNLDLPIEIKDIERIEILEGPGARIYGANAFSGAINIITKQGSSNSIRLSADAGMYDLYGGAVSSEVKTKVYSHFLTINGNKCSGYTDNTDYTIGNFFYNGNCKAGNGGFSLQLGYMDKAFGANSFYSPKYPEQFEHTKTKFSTLKYSWGQKIKISPLIYWRRHNDKFELFRNTAPSWYKNHNYHVTDVYGAEVNISILSVIGKTSVGIDYRDETIHSNVLGNTMDDTIRSSAYSDCFYTKYKTRLNSGLFIEQSYSFKKLTIAGGLLANWNSDYGIGLYPGIDISYKFNYQYLLFFTINRTLRQPTFTDLYYQGPQNIGNPDLMPEEALNLEIGIKRNNAFIKSSFAIFRRYGKNIIDWVKTDVSDKWKSENLTNVLSDGAEFSFELNTEKLSKGRFPLTYIIFNYSYLSLNKSSGDYISYYVLDYLRNKATIQAQFRIYKTLGISVGFNYNDRAGTYIDSKSGNEMYYPDSYLLDARIFYKIKGFELYADASNIINQHYYDYGNILMPGFWIKGGLGYTFNFDKNKNKK